MLDFDLCYGCMKKRLPDEKFCPSCGFNLDAYMRNRKPGTLKPGTMIDHRYVTGAVLGQGGFGITYIGYDTFQNKTVAIKEYYPRDSVSRDTEQTGTEGCRVSVFGDMGDYREGLDRFLKEARTLAQFNRLKGIVTVSAYIEENNTGYIIMDYLPGRSLKKIIEGQKKPMPEEEVMHLLRPVMHALREIHRYGLIHRDISPDNLIMNDDGRLTLIDFGAARQITQNSKNPMTVILKKGYAPLEQSIQSGKQGPWTDVYALAATIYYMVTHAVPEQAIERLRDDPVYTLWDLGMPVSREFSDAVAVGMAVDYRDRFQSMEVFEEALLGHMPVSAHPMSRRSELHSGKEDNGNSVSVVSAGQNGSGLSSYRSIQRKKTYISTGRDIPPAPARPEEKENNNRMGMLAAIIIISGLAVIIMAIAVFLLL